MMLDIPEDYVMDGDIGKVFLACKDKEELRDLRNKLK